MLYVVAALSDGIVIEESLVSIPFHTSDVVSLY